MHDHKQEWKDYFFNSLRKNWQASTCIPHWKKHWIPLFVPCSKVPKTISPTNMFCLKTGTLLPPLRRGHETIYSSLISKNGVGGIWFSNIRNRRAEKCLKSFLIKCVTKPHQHQIVKHLWDKKSALLLIRSFLNYLSQQTLEHLNIFFFEPTFLFYLIILWNVSKILLLNFS